MKAKTYQQTLQKLQEEQFVTAGNIEQKEADLFDRFDRKEGPVLLTFRYLVKHEKPYLIIMSDRRIFGVLVSYISSRYWLYYHYGSAINQTILERLALGYCMTCFKPKTYKKVIRNLSAINS